MTKQSDYIVMWCSPSELHPHPRNNEFFDDIRMPFWNEFVEDIREHGILNPITVDLDGTIICGTQRWRAACELDLKVVPVYVREFANEDERLERLINDNLKQRFCPQDNDVKLAKCVVELKRIVGVRMGRPVKDSANNTRFYDDLSEKLNKSKRSIYRLESLMKLTPELQTAIENRILNVTAGTQFFSQLSEKAQEDLLKQIGVELLGAFTKNELAELIPTVKQLDKERQEAQRMVEELEKDLDKHRDRWRSTDEIEKLENELAEEKEKSQRIQEKFEALLRRERDEKARANERVVRNAESIALVKRVQKDMKHLLNTDPSILRDMDKELKSLYELIEDLRTRNAPDYLRSM